MEMRVQFTVTAVLCFVFTSIISIKSCNGEKHKVSKGTKTLKHLTASDWENKTDSRLLVYKKQNWFQIQNEREQPHVSHKSGQAMRRGNFNESKIEQGDIYKTSKKIKIFTMKIKTKRKTQNDKSRFGNTGTLAVRDFVNETNTTQPICCADKRAKRDVIEGKTLLNHEWREYILKSKGVSVNENVLVEAYSLICPISEYCDMNITNTKYLYTGFFKFAECHLHCKCDPMCIASQDCCPTSIYGYLPVKCKSAVVFPASNTRERNYFMITQCPDLHRNTSHIVKMCSGPDSKVRPVTSRRTLLTYKNHFCAQCHSDDSVTDWRLQSECRGNVTVSYSTRISEIRSKLFDHRCILYYKTDPDNQCILVHEGALIDRCNITGMWTTYNKDIEWACRNFIIPFGDFKNVFCFICNPSSVTKKYNHVISSCNMTGLRKTHYKDLDSACREFGVSDRLNPFKNIYCVSCNGITSMSQTMHGKHSFRYRFYFRNILYTQVEVTKNVYHSGYFLPNNYEKSLSDLKQLLLITLKNDAVIKAPIKVSANFIKDDIVNAFLEEYIAICGHSKICNKSRLNETIISDKFLFNNHICGECSCLPECLSKENCCVDLLLQKNPYSCYKFQTHYPSNVTAVKYLAGVNKSELDYVLIDKCIDSTHWAVDKCERANETDILFNIPIRGSTLLRIFKNVYCYICNNMNRQSHMLFVDIHYYCGGYVEPWLSPHFENEYNWIVSNCIMTMQPNTFATCQSKYLGTIHGKRYTRQPFESIQTASIDYFDVSVYERCNKTGFWSHEIPYIKQICMDNSATTLKLPDYRIENSLYKNVACFICNPFRNPNIFPIEEMVTSCNKSETNTDTDNLCFQGEFHPRWLPYKNFVCKDCSLPPLKQIDVNTFAIAVYYLGRRVTYKSMFYLNHEVWCQMSEDNVSPKQKHIQCPFDSLRFLNVTCDDLQCREGLELVNLTCTPIVDILLNSLFLVKMTITEDKVKSSCKDSKPLLVDICLRIAENVATAVKTTASIELKECIWSNVMTCDETAKSEDDNVKIIEATFLISTIKTVTKFHENLMKFLQKGFQYANDEQHCYLQISFEKYINEYEGTKYCNQETILSNLKHNSISSSVVVDRFFSCPFFEVTVDSENTTTIEGSKDIVINNINIPRKYYDKTENKIRMCLQNYLDLSRKGKKGHKTSKLINVFTYFSNVCTLLSMICLFLTFLTFSIFPRLRTVPGKLNIALTLTLLSAQSIYFSQQFIVSLSSYSLICIALGMACHYFWLASFCAMNACSFHMYRLFAGNLSTFSATNYTSSIKYILYIASAPLVFVTSTVAVNMVISRNKYFGYGTITCFLSDFHSLIISFIIPAGVIFLSNITLFSIAFYNIISSQNRVRSARDRSDFMVYVRLCAIIGVAWPLLVVDGAFEISWFSFVASGMNALQGLFIFCSYVCNTRVLNMYRSVITNGLTDNSSASQRTRPLVVMANVPIRSEKRHSEDNVIDSNP